MVHVHDQSRASKRDLDHRPHARTRTQKVTSRNQSKSSTVPYHVAVATCLQKLQAKANASGIPASRLQRSHTLDEYSCTPFDFMHHTCASLNDVCLHHGLKHVGQEPCQHLWSTCRRAIAAKNDCQTVRSACIIRDALGHMVIMGDTTARKSVHKSRKNTHALAESMRLELPKVLPRPLGHACGGGGPGAAQRLRSATLISPVWPNNFVSVLGLEYRAAASPHSPPASLASSTASTARYTLGLH